MCVSAAAAVQLQKFLQKYYKPALRVNVTESNPNYCKIKDNEVDSNPNYCEIEDEENNLNYCEFHDCTSDEEENVEEDNE